MMMILVIMVMLIVIVMIVLGKPLMTTTLIKTEYCDCADDSDHADDNDDFPGKSRSSTITLAFLIQKTSLTLEDAIVQVVIIDISLTHHCEL